MKIAQRYAAILLILMAAGCSNLGLPSPQTFNQKIAVAIGSVTAVRNSATTLLVAKKITVADAENVQTAANNARAGIDVARTIEASDPVGANSKLTAVTTVLTALQGYLAEKGK